MNYGDLMRLDPDELNPRDERFRYEALNPFVAAHAEGFTRIFRQHDAHSSLYLLLEIGAYAKAFDEMPEDYQAFELISHIPAFLGYLRHFAMHYHEAYSYPEVLIPPAEDQFVRPEHLARYCIKFLTEPPSRYAHVLLIKSIVAMIKLFEEHYWTRGVNNSIQKEIIRNIQLKLSTLSISNEDYNAFYHGDALEWLTKIPDNGDQWERWLTALLKRAAEAGTASAVGYDSDVTFQMLREVCDEVFKTGHFLNWTEIDDDDDIAPEHKHHDMMAALALLAEAPALGSLSREGYNSQYADAALAGLRIFCNVTRMSVHDNARPMLLWLLRLIRLECEWYLAKLMWE